MAVAVVDLGWVFLTSEVDRKCVGGLELYVLAVRERPIIATPTIHHCCPSHSSLSKRRVCVCAATPKVVSFLS